jgi:3-hydroxyisobutyrate dehydrogenase-like beta-hydroxyacid dehydrogenase
MNETVGVIGAGRMGLPIIGHLVRKGFATIATDVDASKKSEVEKRGARWSSSAAALADVSDVILVCVGFDREVRALFEGDLKNAKSGAVCAILSTVHPRTVQALAKGSPIEVIDSTVCRGGEAADQGTLLSFVGGSAETVARVAPVLKAYSADVVHSGPVG